MRYVVFLPELSLKALSACPWWQKADNQLPCALAHSPRKCLSSSFEHELPPSASGNLPHGCRLCLAPFRLQIIYQTLIWFCPHQRATAPTNCQTVYSKTETQSTHILCLVLASGVLLIMGRDRAVMWPEKCGGRLEEGGGRKKAKLEEGRPIETTSRDNDGSSREDQCRDPGEAESTRPGV